MKYSFFFFLFLGAISGVAQDLFLTPTTLITANTFVANGHVYCIDGIEPPTGNWGDISRRAMEQMIKGKEFKFLSAPPKKGKKKEKVFHVYFGTYGRDGKPQPNASVKLLMMGLAKYSKGIVDDNRGKAYAPAENHARKNSLGIWNK